MSDLSNPIFHDGDKAREWLEARMWPDGVVCPHCGEYDNSTKLTGKTHRPGLYQCNGCRQQFTVTVGTLYERSKIPLNKWLMATYLLCASKSSLSSISKRLYLHLYKPLKQRALFFEVSRHGLNPPALLQ